jgi:hypothetical protein
MGVYLNGLKKHNEPGETNPEYFISEPLKRNDFNA